MITQDTLTTILIAASTAAATKSAEEGPAKTLVDIWNIALGHFFSCASEKVKIFWTDFFIPDLTQKISSIPEENLQEPKISIVGPSLEASKYYFDEKEIRDMFANLIASSMNSTYNGLVQHSFVEIIKQLSPLDAKILKDLHGVNPIIDIEYEYNFKTSNHLKLALGNEAIKLLENLYFSEKIPESELNLISIENLFKQGLITIDKFNSLSDKKSYNHYLSSNIFNSYKKDIENKIPPFDKEDGTLNFSYHIVRLSNLGKAFKEVCIKDSL